MKGAQDEKDRAGPEAPLAASVAAAAGEPAATDPKIGPSRPPRIVTAPSSGETASKAPLTVEALELPPPLAAWSTADMTALALALSLHVLLLLTIVERHTRIGGGGSDIEAMGVEIVMVAPALESRRLDGIRDRAAAHRVVGPDEGALPSEAQSPAADRRPVEPSRNDARPEAEKAPAPADLAVAEWVERPPPDKAPAMEPVIARAKGDGEQEIAPRETASLDKSREEKARDPVQQLPAQTPSKPEDAMSAAMPGGFSARGRDVIDGASAVMAAARAGRKDKFGTDVYIALRASVPRPVPGVVGKVTVEFVVSPLGGVQSSRIRATTGSRVLEEAALAAVRSARIPKPPPELVPAELVYSMEYTFR